MLWTYRHWVIAVLAIAAGFTMIPGKARAAVTYLSRQTTLTAIGLTPECYFFVCNTKDTVTDGTTSFDDYSNTIRVPASGGSSAQQTSTIQGGDIRVSERAMGASFDDATARSLFTLQFSLDAQEAFSFTGNGTDNTGGSYTHFSLVGPGTSIYQQWGNLLAATEYYSVNAAGILNPGTYTLTVESWANAQSITLSPISTANVDLKLSAVPLPGALLLLLSGLIPMNLTGRIARWRTA